MTTSFPTACNEELLDRYLDDDLNAAEKELMQAHLENCLTCRRHLETLKAFSRDFCDHVRHVSDSVDFVALEKRVVTSALHRHRHRSRFAVFAESLKYIVPVAVTAGLLIFFAYSTYLAKPAPAPSALINSFTGPVSSVMIFETPETRQTILWYQEAPDAESEHHAD
jgi:hypothetical protein